MFVAASKKMVFEAQTRALNAPRHKYLQRVGWGNKMACYRPKHEFRPKVVDWACLLQKKTRNGSRGINSCIKCTSIPVFASIKECFELLVNFMNKFLIHETFRTNTC